MSSPPPSGAPAVFYTDLTSGPNNGGENNQGTILTICGKNFGTSQGNSYVTIGGGAVASYKIWGGNRPCGAGGHLPLESVVVAIGPNTATGPVVVTVNGVTSNTNVNFTVRPWTSTNSRIFCINSVSGNNANNGQFASDPQSLPGTKGCWASARYARGNLRPGDIAYLGHVNSDGTGREDFQSETGEDPCGGYGSLSLKTGTCGGVNKGAVSGTPSQPIALAGYPGVTATFGGTGMTYAWYGIWTWNGATPAYWTISNITAIGGEYITPPPGSGGGAGIMIEGGQGWRVVNNDAECPSVCEQSGNGGLGMAINHTGAVPGQVSTFIYGNYFHNYAAGVDATNNNDIWRHTAGVYLGTDSDELDFGWNEIDGSAGYNSLGLHIHSSPTSGTTDGYLQYGLHIHDNYFHDTPAGNDGAAFNPGKGSGVEFYNNIFYNQADCLAWPGAAHGWSGGYRAMDGHSFGQTGWDLNWQPSSGTLKIYNNTYYDVGDCSGTGGAGIIRLLNPVGSVATIQPPANVTICWGVVLLVRLAFYPLRLFRLSIRLSMSGSKSMEVQLSLPRLPMMEQAIYSRMGPRSELFVMTPTIRRAGVWREHIISLYRDRPCRSPTPLIL